METNIFLSYQVHKNMKNYHVYIAFLAFHAETVLASGIFFRDSCFFGLVEIDLFWCVPLPAGWDFTGFLIGCFSVACALSFWVSI
jgi:hypothetical protein